MNELQGAGVALVTPFNADGTIDFDSLGNLIDYQINQGMNYLVSLGTTGETATLNEKERKQVWDFTVKQVNKRVPIVAGIGGNNTQEVVQQITNFDTNGFTALLSVSPYYNKPVQEGIYQHYKAIAEASKLPIILYNVPGRTGSNMSPATTVRLAQDFPNIIATKEASGNFAQFNEIMRDKPAKFSLISGDDPVTLPMMAIGAIGIISVVGNAFPKEVAALTKAVSDNDFSSARQLHNALLKITDLCFVEGNPCGVKYILQAKGIIKHDTVRLPLVPVTAQTRKEIDQELNKLQ